MNKLKIGVVVDQLLAGGVQLSAIEQVKELNRIGHQAKLLILMKKEYSTDFSYLVKGVPHQYLSESYPRLFQRTIKFPIFSFLSTLHLMSPILAPGVIKKGDYDILVSLGTTTCLTTQAIYKRQGIPYIAVIHDPIIYILETVYTKTFLRLFFPIIIPLAKHFEQSFVKDAKETIIISRVHYQYLKRNYGIEAKILGLSTKSYERLPTKRGNYLLSFGRWQKQKNPQFLLELLEQLPEAKLIVAGSWIVPEDLKQFREQVRNRALDDRVKIVAHYSDSELVRLARMSRLWLYPHFEAFGLAALEAASLGLPIILPRRSGVTESFNDGEQGFFPNRLSLNEYLSDVKRLLADERLAYRMGKNAAELVKQKFSARSNVSQLLEIVERVLKPQPRRIFVLETGHTPGATLAGGDRLMEPMAVRLVDQYQLVVVVPKLGAGHWQKANFSKRLYILPQNRFEAGSQPEQVFLSYCWRIWQTFRFLSRELTSDLLYSSTNVLPDIMPAYLAKRFRPRTIWLARVHHLIPPPLQRKGRLTVNVVAYIMQIVALSMIKAQADMVMVLNQGLKEVLIKRGFDGRRIQVLGAGIDFDKITAVPAEPTSQSFDGIYLGRLHTSKGVFDLVPIWREVVKMVPKARLAVIGGGQTDLVKQLQTRISNNSLTDNISLMGALPDKAVYNLMKQAKVFLFTDHEAGWGIAVAEAMAAGLPVIGYDIGVLGDVYKHGYVSVPLGDFASFAKNIANLIQNRVIRHKYALAAKAEAKKLDWSITVKRFRTILDTADSLIL